MWIQNIHTWNIVMTWINGFFMRPGSLHFTDTCGRKEWNRGRTEQHKNLHLRTLSQGPALQGEPNSIIKTPKHGEQRERIVQPKDMDNNIICPGEVVSFHIIVSPWREFNKLSALGGSG